MPTVFIDDIAYTVGDGKNMLQVALDLKLDLEYFCWHPAMGSVGACRQCAVKVFKGPDDKVGKIDMACMTPAIEGTRISIKDPAVKEFRRFVIEWLMVNHPHDCPVCDEGGECHLQDMTVMAEHVYRRYRGKKRTHNNQDLGPFVTHEMNRCIQCYRCVRFYRDYAGGRDFDVFASRDRVYFGRESDGVLESEFAGNLVEVCPTGVFTDKTLYRHYTRKWDLETAPSVCIHCGLGCNTIPGARYSKLRRIRARYNECVNTYFLCDRGRYGYEFANHEKRIRECSVTTPSALSDRTNIGLPQAVERAKRFLKEAKGIIGIGSPRASLEGNYALKKLVGGNAFSTGLSAYEQQGVDLTLAVLRQGSSRTPSLAEIQDADSILILGADPTNEAPMIDLAVRQAMIRSRLDIARKLKIPDWDAKAVFTALQGTRGQLFAITPWRIKLEEIALESGHASFSNIARVAGEMLESRMPTSGVTVQEWCERLVGAEEAPSAALLTRGNRDQEIPPTTEVLSPGATSALENTKTELLPPGASPDESRGPSHSSFPEVFARALDSLKNARKPLIITSISAGPEVVEAAARLAWSLNGDSKNSQLSVIVPEANAMGVGLLGGISVEAALARVEAGEADTIIVLENDLSRRVDPVRFERCVGMAKQVIVLDCIETPTTVMADLAIPVNSYFESTGTFVSNECRAQRYYQVLSPPDGGCAVHDWEAIRNLRPELAWTTYEDVLHELVEERPELASILDAAPPANWRTPSGEKIPRQSHRSTGRTAKDADKSVFEPTPPDDPQTPFAFTMEGSQTAVAGSLEPRFWWPGWNSAQAITKFQIEVNGPLQSGNPGKRLIEPSIRIPSPSEGEGKGEGEDSSHTISHVDEIHEGPGDRCVWLLPRQRIFGSEELSQLSPAVGQLIQRAAASISPELAEGLEVSEGEAIEFNIDGHDYDMPCMVDDSLPEDVVSVPMSIGNAKGILRPHRVSIRKRQA
jgi:NADH-quinone oxidoreductase subunit G